MMSKDLIKQILRFLVVGGTATVIDYSIFAILTQFLNIHYLVAQVISFTISLMFNYVASTKWVFNANKQNKKQIIIFVVLSVIGLGINSLLLFIGVDLMSIHELIAKLFATAIVMIYNFITRKLIIEKNN